MDELASQYALSLDSIRRIVSEKGGRNYGISLHVNIG